MKRNTITRLCSLAAAAVLAVSCIALTDITIPESVGYIKTGAFKDCNALTSVTVRSNCRIDTNVFPATVEVNRYAD